MPWPDSAIALKRELLLHKETGDVGDQESNDSECKSE